VDDQRSKLISVIKAPLGFFALSLLIVEGFLGIVLIFSKAPTQQDSLWGIGFYMWGLIVGALLFLVVVIVVTLLAWFKAEVLTLEGPDQLYLLKQERIRFSQFKNKDGGVTVEDPLGLFKN
jgi:hypothetical protein